IDCRQKAKGQKSLQMSHRRRQSSMTTIRLLRSRSARVRFAAALTWDHVPKCLIYDLRAETAEEYGRRSNRAEGSAVARASPEQTIAPVLEALDTLFSER